MASAVSSSLRVRNRRRRDRASGAGRLVRNAIAGLAITGCAVAATGAVAVGLLRLLTTPFEPPAASRAASRFADAAMWQGWNAPPRIGRTAQLAIVASLVPAEPPSPPPVLAAVPAPAEAPVSVPPPVPTPAAAPAPVLASNTAPVPTVTAAPLPPLVAKPETEPAAAPAATLAFATPDQPLGEPEVTGSTGTYSLASVDRAARPPEVAAVSPGATPATPLPRPRPRPQLAALTPPDVGVLKPEPDPRFARTAVYDISARIVYLPNGERLEAHSGLGPFMDDPRHVHRRMRGATPPNSYRLRMREALFHGVRAIRLLPENESAMFGRDGILAHTYMLGPSGQSNGCVSFKDYPRFLRAFLRGEIERMIVVARLDKPPTFFARRSVKTASNSF